jgi:hypothetical protein
MVTLIVCLEVVKCRYIATGADDAYATGRNAHTRDTTETVTNDSRSPAPK